MAKITSNGPQPIKSATANITVTSNKVSKRSVIDLLPVVNQTETLTKFFNATVDHMLQPENVEFINGYIGAKPSYYDNIRDYYVTESTKAREDYQLPVTAVSVDLTSNAVNNVMFYDDVIGQLQLQGANVSDPNRLFESEYYSWSPPINPDKFVNFYEYYWLPGGPGVIQLLDPTNLQLDAVGKTEYEYNGTWYRLADNTTVTGNLKFSSGMRITTSYDEDNELNNVYLIVEDVGTAIKIEPDYLSPNPGWDIPRWNIRGWDGDKENAIPDYMTLGRISKNWNRWSVNNRWFHKDVILTSGLSIFDLESNKALRPIIEFHSDLQLYNHGTFGRPDVDIIDTTTTDIFAEIAGKVVEKIPVGSTSVYGFNVHIAGTNMRVGSGNGFISTESAYLSTNAGSIGNVGTNATPYDGRDVIVYASNLVIDGINLIDGMTILVTADKNPSVNNRIYRVSGIQEYGIITLTLISDGQDLSGAPAYGDCTYSVLGTINGNKSWWYNGTKWIAGQQRKKYQAPLFEGFDMHGNLLKDPSVYPNSDFAGNSIFTYSIDNTQPIDPKLGIRAKRDQFGFHVFENTQATSSYNYFENGSHVPYNGYVWYKIKEIGNSWHKPEGSSRQYIVNSFNVLEPTITFEIDQTPALNKVGFLPTIKVFLISNGNSKLLVNNIDYYVSNNIVSLSNPAPVNSRIEIHSWNTTPVKSIKGYYQLPINLVGNPNNDEPSVINFNQVIKHFSGLISNQFQEKTNGVGSTGWRDSAKIFGLGTEILQHRSPLLKLMILNSTNINTGPMSNMSTTDPSLVIQWAQHEYVRFYNRFLRTLFNLNKQGYDNQVTTQVWIDAALRQLNIGKSKSNAWAYSGYEQNEDFTSTLTPTFVPPTAAKLGITPVYQPYVYLDKNYYPPKITIQTHDGSRIIMEDIDGLALGTIKNQLSFTVDPTNLTDPIAGVWLQLELNIYSSIPERYKKVDAVLAFDQRIIKPGKWRNQAGLVDYSYSEYIDIIRPSFDKWVIVTQADYSANTTYQANNQFTFNYNKCFDNDNNPIPGHWRGIYKWFYDTDRPDTNPWEMLGFSQKPTWWDTTYGVAPYTRGNKRMWEDLRDGIIREGDRAGQYPEWARPGLLSCIPVDEQGMLLPPLLAGTVASLPSSKDAVNEWKFGDCGPVENAWINSVDHSYVIALTSYLMKPVRFIEQTWDPLKVVQVGNNEDQQFLYINTNKRRSSVEFYMHRENPSNIVSTVKIPNESNLTFFGSWGLQHWFAEYLTNQNFSVTTYAGQILRGSYSSLAHKFGGFVSTDNSLRVMVDSFGQLGYTSQLVPSENIRTYLYRSTSLGTYFYSGIIVVKQSNGWKVYGYDGILPKFTIIPSIKTGKKTNTVIGNITVTEYSNGTGIGYVPYGQIFDNVQDVFDFIISYGRWLESQGWVFENVNESNNKVVNWRQAARDFIYWSQGNWGNGNFIAISPGADLIKFKKEFGTIQYVNGTIGGTYPILDKQGQPIESKDLEVLRYNDELTITSTNKQAVYGLRLFVTSVEHIMLVDNLTQFNDLIYDPLYSIYQPRLKMYGYRTNGWTGRLDAPGYFLYQDTITNQWKMIENFEKTTEDFRKIFNIDQPKNIYEVDNISGILVEKTSKNHVVTRSEISDLAKHTLGFQKREYLENLLLDDTTQFEFYQGFIGQKGSLNSLNGMLRNSNILGDGEKINYYEEFAFRKSRYGATSLNTNIDFIINQAEYVNDPQRIDVFSEYDSSQQRDSVIVITVRDPHIVVPPDTYEGKLFPLRESVNNVLYRDLPTSGYVLLGESNYNVLNQDELFALSSNLNANEQSLVAGNVIWQYITPSTTWEIWKVVNSNSKVTGTIPQTTRDSTAIMFEYAHGIVVGDIVVISGFTANNTLNGTFTVSEVTDTMIYVPISTFIEDSNGVVKILRSKRFYSKSDLDEWTLSHSWDQNDLTYVDNGIKKGQWTVYRWNLGGWEIYRKAEPKVDARLIISSRLYNKISFNDIKALEYYDPSKGLIPGIVDKEISYKTVYDPAQYTSGTTDTITLNASEAWTEPHVGEVWWDLSTTRYIDYEAGPIDYRAKNWGKIAPNTSIDIYEWVKSTIPPLEWSAAVSSGTVISRYGVEITPSGIVRNADNPAWVERTEYDQHGNARIWYYFWVKASSMPPLTAGRTLTTIEISRIIQDPGTNSIPWFAVISERSVLVSNIGQLLDNTNVVMQINYTTKPNEDNDYKEWTIIRKNDPSSYIDSEYWQKLRDSLTGYDNMNNLVPDIRLNDLQKYGNLFRPRQSWFKNRYNALAIFAARVNSQLLSASTPLVLDSAKTTWRYYFEQSEPIPPARGNYEYKINDMSELELIRPNAVAGERVLVMPTAFNGNMWTIWLWDDASKDFILYRKQSYNVENYWNYTDWYAEGYDSTVIADYTTKNIEDRNELNISTKTIIKVLDYGSLGWALFEADISTGVKVWKLIGLQDGTVQINKNLWNTDINLSGFDQTGLDSTPFDYNPTIEIGLIYDGIINGIYADSGKTELNELFFAMINYVFSENTYVDWVFKTSFISMNGSKEQLSNSELYKPNTVDLLLEYLNEAKPYRAKVREFVSSRVAFDESSVKLSTDFDKPPYDDPTTDTVRILSELTTVDQNVMINSHNVSMIGYTFDYNPWFNNYKTNPQLIRRLKTKLVFDRVSSMPKFVSVVNAYANGSTVSFTIKPDVGAKSFKVREKVYISNVNATTSSLDSFTTANGIVKTVSGNVIVVNYDRPVGIGTGIGGAIYHGVTGSADRIMRNYAPSQYMPGAFSPDLISGTDYQGTIYTGADLNWEPGWGVSPWGFQTGWAAEEEEFEALIEVLLEGGMPIIYDTFYGDGSRTMFKLSRVSQDWYGSKIWADKKLLKYGVDFITPNYAERLIVSIPGKNYQVGETLTLVEDNPRPGSVPIECTIQSVRASGGIREVVVTNPGYFDVVQEESYHVKYSNTYYNGNGVGARIQPVWGGSTIKFTVPPASSERVNIRVLYSGTTFNPAPDGEYDTIIDNNAFVQPNVEADHAEELFTGQVVSSIKIDTYTSPLGGMPYVSQKSYLTKGIDDHYDIGLRPQDDAAITVFLDGKILKYGPTYDYVVNFETGQLVFIVPPAPDKWLTIIAVGEGGGGNTIHSAYPVTRGTGYIPGDRITFDGGVATLYGTTGARQRGVVTIETVRAVGLNITSSGVGYKTNEILQLSNNNVIDSNVVNKLLIKVTKVNRLGEVIEAQIVNAGSYKEIPASYIWITANNTASGLGITAIWGVDTVSIYQAGLYTEKPIGAFTQYIPSQTNGTGATFNASFTSIVYKETFVADGVASTFNLKKSVDPNSSFFVIVNGQVGAVIGTSENSFTLYDPPATCALIVLTVFNTNQYSFISSEDIVILEDPTFYLGRYAGNTSPTYSSVEVSLRGNIIPPPIMYLETGDGATFQFDLEYIPADQNNLKIYIDGRYEPYRTISGTRVTFDSPPPANSSIVFLIEEPRDFPSPYYFITDDGGFQFGNIEIGAIVNIKTYTQDLSYRFAVETFEGSETREYELKGTPSSESTIIVTVNGVLKRMLWDYGIVRRTKTGYDIFGYDAQPFDTGPVRYFIVFGPEANPGLSDVIAVRYMRGAGERPATAFRQFIDKGMYRQSQVLATTARTVLLSNVLVNSSNLYIADSTTLSAPSLANPGSIWIGNEKIDFYEMLSKPTPEYPNRALITGLVRGSGGTCYSPEMVDNLVFFDSNGLDTIFPTPSGLPTFGITVFVNDIFQAGGTFSYHEFPTTGPYIIAVAQPITNVKLLRVYRVNPSDLNNTVLLIYNVDYYIQGNNTIVFNQGGYNGYYIKVERDVSEFYKSNYFLGSLTSTVASLFGQTAGWYVIFDSIPPIGWKNIKFVTKAETSTTICHFQGTIVQDAGKNSIIPGGYNWEPAPQGLQMNITPMAKFLNDHPGTPD